MANQERAHRVTPEERLAARLLERHGLRPPVPVRRLAEHYASVVFAYDFPIAADGVTLNLKRPGIRPSIVINERGRTEERMRFTLAHELGHIFIPSHVGKIVDIVDAERTDAGYWAVEGEANRFAAELLMPSAWMSNVMVEYPNPDCAAAYVATMAEVSLQAAVIRWLEFGPPNFTVALISDNSVVWSKRTNGTAAYPPVRDQVLNVPDPLLVRNEYLLKYRSGYYIWREYRSTISLAPQCEPDWRQVLLIIMSELALGDPARAQNQISAVLSAVNSGIKTARSPERVYAACRQRLERSDMFTPDVFAIITHRDFDKYLSARVRAYKYA